jgi:non-lysosomal glucosylceramidase
VRKDDSIGRRAFLKSAAGVVGAATQVGAWQGVAEAERREVSTDAAAEGIETQAAKIEFPRTFTGPQLKTIAFPLGGVAAGSLSLGGRGQLRDWEIFNRPNKGYAPAYGFPSIRIRTGNSKPITRVLEARILPPYEGSSGLGSDNVPGLTRIAEAEFLGAYPLARVRFNDPSIPVKIELEAFSPFIPHDPDDSGLPVAILRYRVSNPTAETAQVSIAFSIDNPVKPPSTDHAHVQADARVNEYLTAAKLEGITMNDPSLAAGDPMRGSFVLAAQRDSAGQITHWRGWPKGPWWNAPMLFWDAFSRDGALLQEPAERSSVAALCVQKAIPASTSASFTFVLAWHFPNRTPDWCGWDAPKGDGSTIIGNYYSTRFKSAWEVAQYTADNLDRLESRTRAFADAFAASTLPAAVKDAASANLSTLASTVCFRTADGEFHGFEGVDDHLGCCFGNCTHVWNYETATAFLFPSFARSLRKASFGYSMDDEGGMRFRQLLPDGKERFGTAAADGQMGQIIHAYLDWKLSGDSAWIGEMWPRIKKAISFAWVQNGWDPGRTGVLTGVQHNTYDVEFFGPNPLCGIFHLGALRACEEIARFAGDDAAARDYRALFEKGRTWIDANLFQGEFYIQKVRGYEAGAIAPHLRAGMGSENTVDPQYQAGSGCLADQLIGQYLASVAGLGPLVDPQHMRVTMQSVFRYNYKATLIDHDCVQRTYALNDEGAVMVCDYGKGERPEIPFPYYAEAWTGIEYLVATLMFYAGMIEEGVEVVAAARARYDGMKRNPWDEEECGHHYARAMSSWSTVVALSGFSYSGDREAVTAMPLIGDPAFQSFWATGTGWGSFSIERGKGTSLAIRVLAGTLPCQSCTLRGVGTRATARVGTRTYAVRVEQVGDRITLHFPEQVNLAEGSQLEIEVQA